MAAKIYISLHHDLANDGHKKHHFGVYNKIFEIQEFSYVAPEGHIATTIKLLNLITIIIVTHQVLIGNSCKVNFGQKQNGRHC